ncbi:MAG TPA: discoidin domain-containing protein [Planctomycetota bacterium]|nr:discoidin domain-containing protein [Planctomycetota bacterium]
MKTLQRLARCVVTATLAFGMGVTPVYAGEDEFPPQPPVPALSAEETLKLFELPEGYSLELVLDEKVIQEPVVLTFDGNGRMYIAEMRTYMQDIDGKNQHAPKGVVSRHESTKGDGVYDKHTIFQDELILPRMVLPLDNGRAIIGTTDTNDFKIYTDKNGDGKADSDAPFYEGGPRGGNLEHQPSGLIWAMDNRLYTTYNNYRLRWENNRGIKEPTASNGAQWGLAQDDHGKVWFSNAGGEQGFVSYQTHIQYAGVNLKEQNVDKFLEVWPLVPIPDVQGGKHRFRPVEKTLNHLTASCGHEIFRGDRLPEDMRGNAFICEPVGRLIRRAKVEVKDGITYVSNPYEKEQKEFIRSRDPNFRPVNMVTGPDGCLYIVDMYRGIIQEGNWVKEGSWLRKVVQQYQLDKNFGRGRIWRVVHKDFKPGPQPKMLDETPAQLVAHLEHPNGWWRDTAQKLLVIKGDKSVAPALAQLAKSSPNYKAKLHALWTLEGLDCLTPEIVGDGLKDAHPQVRAAAIRVSEKLYQKDDKSLVPEITKLFTDPDPTVALQALMTAKYLNLPEHQNAIATASATHPSKGVKDIGKILLNVGKPESKDQFSPEELKLLTRGGEIYKELCFGCHGYDGKGMPMQGAPAGTTMAPPLGGSKTLMRDKDAVIYVLLHGMSGPIEGKTYDAQMVSMATNDDAWIAAAGSYVRNSFGNRGALIKPEDVKRLRAATKDRTKPWTVEELMAVLPGPLQGRDKWKLASNFNEKTLAHAVDGKPDTRWDTGKEQAAGMWLTIELPEVTAISGIWLDAGKSRNDFPRGYKVEVSTDGKQWGKPVAQGKGNAGKTEINFAAVTAKFIRITQTGAQKGTFWSIHEMELIAPKKVDSTKSSDAGKATQDKG